MGVAIHFMGVVMCPFCDLASHFLGVSYVPVQFDAILRCEVDQGYYTILIPNEQNIHSKAIYYESNINSQV